MFINIYRLHSALERRIKKKLGVNFYYMFISFNLFFSIIYKLYIKVYYTISSVFYQSNLLLHGKGFPEHYGSSKEGAQH